MTFDLLLRGGQVVTGDGRTFPEADVAVHGGRIVALAPRVTGAAFRTIDAAGMVVCPGFIDAHSHSDLEALRNPDTDHKVVQGITTEVIGSCGFSLYPFTEAFRGQALDFLAQILEGVATTDLCADAGEYFRRLGSVSTNLISFAGHNMIRIAVNGYGERLDAAALTRAGALLEQQLAAGAAGMSIGMLYTPTCFADGAELDALAGIVRRSGKTVTCHIRDEGNEVEASVEEMLGLVERSRVSLEISHLKVSGRANWGRMPAVLHRLEQAAAQGLPVTFDSYPYLFGCTTLMCLLPRDLLAMKFDDLIRALHDPSLRRSLRARMTDAAGLLCSVGAGNILIASCSDPTNADCVGKNLSEIAAWRRKDLPDLICDLIVSERGRTTIFLFQADEADLRLALKHPLGCLGTDGIPMRNGIPHPRLRSAFLQMLRRYVAEERLCPLPDAVRKMTALPAWKFGLAGRGTLALGNVADIVAFDLDRVRPGGMPGTAQERRGVDYVVMAGQVVVENAEYNGTRAGALLRLGV